MYSVQSDTTSLVPGFPIRTSSDPRSVDSSPRHIAASHVLHRLPVPRHPPCALKHLQTQNQKFIKTFKIAHQHQRRTAAARCSQPLSTNQTPHPTTKARQQHAPIPQPGDDATPGSPHAGQRGDGPVVSKPNSVFSGSLTGVFPTGSTFVVHPNPTHYRWGPSIESPNTRCSARCGPGRVSWCSLERR